MKMKKSMCLFIPIMLFLFFLSYGCGAMPKVNAEAPSLSTQEPPAPDYTPPPPSMTAEATPNVVEELTTPEPEDGLGQPELPKTEYSVFTENYEWVDGVSFLIYQITGLVDQEKESRINNELKAAATDWLVDSMKDAVSIKPGPYAGTPDELLRFQTDRFLSVSYVYEFPQQRLPCPFIISVTIDIETGNRVFLDDLVEINEDFLKHILDDDIAVDYGPNARDLERGFNRTRELFNDMSYEELSQFLDSCQMDNIALKQYLETGGQTSFLNGFYIDEGILVFTKGQGNSWSEIAFNLDDIEEFLKVPKW